MKFGENLQTHLTPEWRSQYIDYEFLKSLLYECKEQSPDTELTEESSIQRYYARFEEKFFAVCEKELTKVNTFYSEKLAESTRRFTSLQSELQAQKANRRRSVKSRRKSEFFIPSKKKTQVRTVKDLKLAFSEFYLSLILLQNYQDLNFTGFRKILKKHDKNLATDKGLKWRMQNVETAPFYTDTYIGQLILKTETDYINDLEDGDRSKAMKRLRVPPLTEYQRYPRWTVFRVGFFTGMYFISLIAILLAIFLLDVNVDPWLVLDLYRPGLVLYMFLFFIGINTWGWRSAGVNHVLIFEIDPRKHLSAYHLFELASISAILWAVSGILLIVGHLATVPEPGLPVYISPGVLYGIYFTFLLNPFPIFYHKARFWLLKRLWRLFACGFYPVQFADFWLADQLTSLGSLFLDFEFLICYYAFDGSIWDGWRDSDRTARVCGSYAYGIRAVLACYPAWIRFIQCLRRFYDSRKWFPHFVNAGKYSTTFLRVTFGALFSLHNAQTGQLSSVYFYIWLASLFINSCYTLAWDLKMDWGFLDKNAGENKWLREEIVYSYKSYYYFGIVEDCILRFAWVIRIALEQATNVPRSITSTLFIVLEVFRRFVWNFFRLENEHLNNCGEFRAVRDISVSPIREDDLTSLIRMMDDIDGVEQCRRRVKEGGSSSKSTSKKLGILRRNTSGAVHHLGGSDEEGTSATAI